MDKIIHINRPNLKNDKTQFIFLLAILSVIIITACWYGTKTLVVRSWDKKIQKTQALMNSDYQKEIANLGEQAF
ncbi:MAG: hypothetical protein WCO23_00085 [bacterium]